MAPPNGAVFVRGRTPYLVVMLVILVGCPGASRQYDLGRGKVHSRFCLKAPIASNCSIAISFQSFEAPLQVAVLGKGFWMLLFART